MIFFSLSPFCYFFFFFFFLVVSILIVLILNFEINLGPLSGVFKRCVRAGCQEEPDLVK